MQISNAAKKTVKENRGFGKQQEQHQKQVSKERKLGVPIVPNFVRLFIFRRLLKSQNNESDSDTDTSNETYIQNLVNAGFSKNKSFDKLHAYNILLRLMTNSLEKYMATFHNSQKDSDVMEMIFNKIIITKFEKEYNMLVTYMDAYDKCCFKNVVFNTSDLMSQIFHYAQDDFNDFINHSLVNSHWFYHSYNINSMYYFDLTRLMQQTFELDPQVCNNSNNSNDNNNNNMDNSVTRMWQRLIKVKHICLETDKEHMWHGSNLLLSKLSILTNVEIIRASIYDSDYRLDWWEQLLKQCQDKIKWFHVDTNVTHTIIGIRNHHRQYC